jgi:nicotinate-nucleotide adenylyltransferase
MNMLRLALGKRPDFEISDIELTREGPSYTIDTLDELRRQRPHDELFLIIGADNVCDIETWHKPARIFERATVAAANRPGYSPHGKFANNVVNFKMPPADVSSTEIRERARNEESLSGLVTPGVEQYINQKHLYINNGKTNSD